MCATYGAGLSTACVVDVGEERTHICCVEDGMSNSNTRYILFSNGKYLSSKQDVYTCIWRNKYPCAMPSN